MRTRGSLTALVLAASLVAACGGGPSNAASHSPASAAESTPAVSASTSASSSPSAPLAPLTGSYGVLVNPAAGSGSYTVAIVGVDGRVTAGAQASSPAAVSCANSAAAVVPPPVSTSDHRLYFMDASGAVRYLGPNGESGQATTVPAGTASRRSMFAVSPDDQRIAVVVDDFTSGGASTRLYVENLTGGGNHLELFSESGAYSLWPIGWHGTNNLVLAKVPSCTQGGGPFCCGPLELHVIDPATGDRRFTLGGASCVVAGSPSPAGVVCESTASYAQATVLNWTAGTVKTLSISGPAYAYLRPSGEQVALVDNNATVLTPGGAASMQGFFACTWIDDDHLLSGGDAQHQPRVVETTHLSATPVAAQGDCGGRLPGGL